MRRFLPVLTFLAGGVLGGLAVWLFLTSGRGPQGGARKPGAAEIAWGTPAGGLQAGISKEEGASGIPVIGYHVRNTGDRELRILKLEVASRYVNTWLEVTVDGNPRPYSGPMIQPPPPPHRSDFVNLTPGQSDSLRGPFGGMSWKLERGERAVLTFVFENRRAELDGLPPYDPQTKSGQKVTGLWTGQARSGTVEVAVR